MPDWHLLVDRDDFRRTRLIDADPGELAEGDVRLRVDAFGLTANNVTYAAAGDLVGYWSFFPAPDLDDGVRWGRVPVWGFADVVESRSEAVAVGERVFGYLPMSTELVVTPIRVAPGALTDGATHRAQLPPVYNRYVRCVADPGFDPAHENEQMLYRPLFFTSFLIDDFLSDEGWFGADTIVLTSASSKTAFGTAHLLAARGGPRVAGLTSSRNLEFVTGLGVYGTVHTYDDVDELPDGSAVLVDFSGDAAVVRAVHERYGGDLRHSAVVGITHWEDRGTDPTRLPGPRPTMFFAPSRIEQRHADWGPGVVEARLAEAWGPFVERVTGWVAVEHGHGPDAVAEVFAAAVEGAVPPSVAHVLHP